MSLDAWSGHHTIADTLSQTRSEGHGEGAGAVAGSLLYYCVRENKV